MSENKKDLKYFMRNTETEIVTAPGPNSFKDENGKVIQFEIKVLSQEQINKINDAYRRKSMATDKKGNPLIAMGEVVWKTEKDTVSMFDHFSFCRKPGLNQSCQQQLYQISEKNATFSTYNNFHITW